MQKLRPNGHREPRWALLGLVAVAALALVLSSCTSAQLDEAGNAVQQAGSDAGGDASGVASDIGNAVDDAGKDVAGAVSDAGDDISNAVSGSGDSGSGGGSDSGDSGGGSDSGGSGGSSSSGGSPSASTGTGEASNTPWWLAAILLGLVGLLIGFILRGNRARSSRPAPRQQAAPPANTNSNSSIDDALSTAQWLVDDLSIDISNPQTHDPQQRLSSAGPRLDDAHIAFINEYQTTGNEVWNDLSRELSATRSALEQYAGIVSKPGFDQATAQQSAQVVNKDRTQLSSSIQQGWNALRS